MISCAGTMMFVPAVLGIISGNLLFVVLALIYLAVLHFVGITHFRRFWRNYWKTAIELEKLCERE